MVSLKKERGIYLDLNTIVFIDTEIDLNTKKVLDIGAVTENGSAFHSGSLSDFSGFLKDKKYICGHNILRYDLKYLEKEISDSGVCLFIDTLYWSPLLFPKKPYHSLVKDDKLTTDELNNPLNDARKAKDLFHDELAAFQNLDERMQRIYYNLLRSHAEFKDFFHCIGYEHTEQNISELIHKTFGGKICKKAPIEQMAKKYPIELAYAAAQISVIQHDSITPPWVIKNYPRVENIMHFLRSQNCLTCKYCSEFLDETIALKNFPF